MAQRFTAYRPIQLVHEHNWNPKPWNWAEFGSHWYLNVFQNSHCVSSWAFSASKMAGRAGRGGVGVETSWQDFQNTPTILKQRFQISNKQTRQSIASTILQKHQNTFPWVSSPGPPFKSGEFPWVEVGVLFRLWVNVLRVMTE